MNTWKRAPADLLRYVVLLGLAAASLLPAWAGADEVLGKATTLSFASGGTIHATVKVGAVEIVGTADDRITVSWRSTSPGEDPRVKVELRPENAKEASLEVDGPGNHVQYRIEVPSRSNLELHMRAGDLAIRGVVGSLHTQLLAGNLELRIADPRDYRSVRASVTAGDIDARPWRVDRGGLWRSFDANGDGEYEIKAYVMAGQLTIRRD